MQRKLGETKLRDGSRLQLCLTQAPDVEMGPAIVDRLIHKGWPWVDHLRLVFADKVDRLESRFYLGLFDGAIAGNITLFESGFCAILGHVFTALEHRRKGICSELMRILLDDARERNLEAITLHAEFESAPHRIYQDFGFRGVAFASGAMLLRLRPDFAEIRYRIESAEWREPCWADWPRLSVLFSLAGGDWLRHAAHRQYGPDNFEGGLIRDLMRVDKPPCFRRVLAGASGAVVGYATLTPDTLWDGSGFIFDFHTHPLFRAAVRVLAQGIEWPRTRTQAFAAGSDKEKLGLLEDLGFAVEAKLRGRLRNPDGEDDVIVLIR